ncbi:MAG: hypothetical protein V1790_01000 [Planctomycetota bacterium]
MSVQFTVQNNTGMHALNWLGSAVLVVLAGAGCFQTLTTLPSVQPDLEAMVAVVSDVYRTRGRARTVPFLDAGEVCDSSAPTCVEPGGHLDLELKERLEVGLHMKVRPLCEADLGDPYLPALTPVLPETDVVGVSISLGRLKENEDSYWHIKVTIAPSGADASRTGSGPRFCLVFRWI